MSSADEVRIEPQVFGNLSVPRRSGLGGLSMGVSAALIPVVLLGILFLATGRWLLAGALVLAAAVAVLLLVATKRQGRSIYGRTMLRLSQRVKEKSGRDLYLAGPTGKGTPDGATRLPGLMAKSELSEFTDSYGNPFGLIRLSGAGVHNYSVVIETHPDGDSLVDREQIDHRVAVWGSWLTQRGLDEGIRGASVTIESSPDSGLRLAGLLEANRQSDSPDYARAVTEQIGETYQGGAPQLVARVTVTFDGRRLDGRTGDRGFEDMAEEISTRLPAIVGGLAGTGAGSVKACTAQQIIDFTRVAYDPTVASLVEEMQAQGGTGLGWQDAGPSFARDAFEHYRHDRAVSKSWTMYEGPAGHFTSTSLRRVLEPSPELLRKRVTLLYRPIPADRTTAMVQQEQNDAAFAGSQTRRNARAALRQAAAAKTAQEEAQGAGLTRFGLVITISAATEEDLRPWNKRIPGLVAPARLRLRPALANQAVTFQAGLPLGLVLPDHMLVPDSVREFF
ncbi:SCO6880 family protein [Citricoccus sp. GCM10030269]|uniref:SCO6880 family protein n=1 Tax=Citricoccus sp. GCM10030269 TaxID=3273388 RepID=UPI003605BEC2